jgi:hypothetical protein
MTIHTWKIHVGKRLVDIDQTIVVREDSRILISNIDSTDEVWIGNVKYFPKHGLLEVSLNTDEGLKCSVGLVELSDGKSSVELDIQPSKMTVQAFTQLREDLHNLWLNICFGDSEVKVALDYISLIHYWRRIRGDIQSFIDNPPRQLASSVVYESALKVRGVVFSGPSLVRLKNGQGTVQSFSARPFVCSEEFGLIKDTLIIFKQILERQMLKTDSDQVNSALVAESLHEIRSLLNTHPLSEFPRKRQVTHLARSDPRFRSILKIRGDIISRSLPVVEGPGDIRSGIKSLDLLYEYWVFLKVIHCAIEQYGTPMTDIQTLARKSGERRYQLEIPPGSEVRFPGGVSVVFTPHISTDPRRSYAKLDLPGLTQRGGTFVTPDVLVIGQNDDAVVLDAKYRSRHQIELESFEIHKKYGHIRRSGRGVVRNVIVAHPHPNHSQQYAGLGFQTFIPFQPVEGINWPKSLTSDSGEIDESLKQEDSKSPSNEPNVPPDKSVSLTWIEHFLQDISIPRSRDKFIEELAEWFELSENSAKYLEEQISLVEIIQEIDRRYTQANFDATVRRFSRCLTIAAKSVKPRSKIIGQGREQFLVLATSKTQIDISRSNLPAWHQEILRLITKGDSREETVRSILGRLFDSPRGRQELSNGLLVSIIGDMLHEVGWSGLSTSEDMKLKQLVRVVLDETPELKIQLVRFDIDEKLQIYWK